MFNLCCKRYSAICIWCGTPVIVIIRSSRPVGDVPISILAPESSLIWLMRSPPFPMIIPPRSFGMVTYKQTNWCQEFSYFILGLGEYFFIDYLNERSNKNKPELLKYCPAYNRVVAGFHRDQHLLHSHRHPSKSHLKFLLYFIHSRFTFGGWVIVCAGMVGRWD